MPPCQVDNLEAADAVVYTAREDDGTEIFYPDGIQSDIDFVIRLKKSQPRKWGCVKFVFWLTADRCYAPSDESTAAGNTTDWGGVSGITIHSTHPSCYDTIPGFAVQPIPYPVKPMTSR